MTTPSLDTILNNALERLAEDAFEPCPFCAEPMHLNACPAMLDFVSNVKASIHARTALAEYRARDARIAIGLPILQDNNEFEWPGYLDGRLIAFYPNVHAANLALWNLISAPIEFASV
jgi:hypothetical protein